eukprot:scaffold434_cov186-Pinguiococcus_pyrenoidosus.AAC.4
MDRRIRIRVSAATNWQTSSPRVTPSNSKEQRNRSAPRFARLLGPFKATTSWEPLLDNPALTNRLSNAGVGWLLGSSVGARVISSPASFRSKMSVEPGYPTKTKPSAFEARLRGPSMEDRPSVEDGGDHRKLLLQADVNAKASKGLRPEDLELGELAFLGERAAVPDVEEHDAVPAGRTHVGGNQQEVLIQRHGAAELQAFPRRGRQDGLRDSERAVFDFNDLQPPDPLKSGGGVPRGSQGNNSIGRHKPRVEGRPWNRHLQGLDANTVHRIPVVRGSVVFEEIQLFELAFPRMRLERRDEGLVAQHNKVRTSETLEDGRGSRGRLRWRRRRARCHSAAGGNDLVVPGRAIEALTTKRKERGSRKETMASASWLWNPEGQIMFEEPSNVRRDRCSAFRRRESR